MEGSDEAQLAQGGESGSLLDNRVLGARLVVAAGALGVLAVGGMVVEGLVSGLTFGTMLRWAGLFAVAMLVTSALLVAFGALRGAGRAQRRGERLSGSDVGVLPPARRRRK